MRVVTKTSRSNGRRRRGGRGARLRPGDWKSGDRLWLVELVAPFAMAENKLQEAMMTDLIENVFKGRAFRLYVVDPVTGRKDTREIGGKYDQGGAS